MGALRQELAALLSSVQLLKEDNPGRKIAEIQGKLATVPPAPSPGRPGEQPPAPAGAPWCARRAPPSLALLSSRAR